VDTKDIIEVENHYNEIVEAVFNHFDLIPGDLVAGLVKLQMFVLKHKGVNNDNQ